MATSWDERAWRRQYMRRYRAQDLDAHEATRDVSALNGVLGTKWSEDEDEQMKRMLHEGCTVQQVAEQLHRSTAGVAARLRRKGWTGANVPAPVEGS